MPQHKSAKKRVITNEKRRQRNVSVKSDLRTRAKRVRSGSGTDDLTARLKEAHTALDKAAKKGVIHPRTAARRKSRLAKHVNRAASTS